MDFSRVKENKALLFLLVLAFLIRIIFLFHSPVKGWDETVYLNLGEHLSEHPTDYSFQNLGWSDFIPSEDPIYGWPNAGFRAPLLPYTLSLFHFLSLSFLIPLIVPLFGTLSVLLVYLLGRELFNKKT